MRTYVMMTVAAASLATAAPAAAATYLITYTGTVSSSYDGGGIFSAVGSSLDGDTFKAVYTLTDPTPGAYTNGDGSTFSETYGGALYGPDVPSPVYGKLTIDGVTKLFDGGYFGQVDQYNNYYSGQNYDQLYEFVYSNNYSNLLQNYVYSYVNNIVNSSNYTDSLHYTVKDGDETYGSFQLYNDDQTDYTYGTLTAQTVDISLASAVPELSTWLMLVGGVGLAGGAVRRRTATARLAFA